MHSQVNGGLTKLLDAQPRNTAVVIIDDSYSFLPSGQTGARPLGGVTKNYHCRDEKPGRNGKSVARLRAVHPSFANQIHNVIFKPGFKTVRVAHKTHGIAINHYRLQAWEVFAMRWMRTFGTFSKAKGHGRDVTHPNEFFLKEAALCPVVDTHLRDYIMCTFSSRAAPPLCEQTRPALITGVGGTNSALYSISLMVRQHNLMAMVS